jgi:hypothetical protein
MAHQRTLKYLLTYLFSTACVTASHYYEPDKLILSNITTKSQTASRWMSTSTFFKVLDIHKITSCLKTTQTPTVLEYRFEMSQPPQLILTETKQTPTCISKELKIIPVFESILFQKVHPDLKRLFCFFGELQSQVKNNPSLFTPPYLKVELPIAIPNGQPDYIISLLTTWALFPYINAFKTTIQAFSVEDALCKNMMQENYLNPNRLPYSLEWPQ